MRVEVHVLQNFAPSNLNRDDTGTPKDCEFGGYRRARISSQCIKRAVRRYFQGHDLIPATNRAVRTKRLLEHAHERLKKDGRDEAAVRRAVTTALAAGGLKLDEKKKNETQYLLFLGEGEIARFVALVDRHFEALAKEPAKTDAASADAGKKKTAKKDKSEAKGAAPEEVQKAVPALLDGGKAADLALFGRMLADLPEKNVDAACQVAHAISTNEIHSMEMDYFTAVDDLKESARKQGLSEDAGAGMIETTAFNSACFYRYATLDVAELLGGYRDEKKTRPFGLQGDAELTRTTVAAFLSAFIHAIPTGKQNSFAAHNAPSLVFAVVRDGSPVSLANAFVKPVHPGRDGDLVALSIKAMDDYYGRLVGMYGDGGLKDSAVCQMDGVKLNHLKKDAGSVEKLIETVVAAGFPAGGGVMSVLLMRLAGPMQSWGTRSRFSNRDTGLEPSRSGVIGLLCAALGRPREVPLDDFLPLKMAVRVDREGRLMRDYHTAQNVRRADPTKGTQDTVLSERFYLADADFLVGLEGDRLFLEWLDGALRRPVWPLFLGRKAFVPSLPVAEGVFDDDLRKVLISRPWRKRHRSEKSPAPDKSLRGVVEVPYGKGEPRPDVPLSFVSRDRRFGVRHVKDDPFPIPQILEPDEESPHVPQQTGA